MIFNISYFEIDKLVEKVFEQNAAGILSDGLFFKLLQNNEKSSSHCYVKVNVYVIAAGMIDIPTEQKILAMMKEMQKNPH